MIAAALSITTLMSEVSSHYCDYRATDMDRVKAVVLAVSHAQDKFGGPALREAVKESFGLEAVAAAAAAAKCPNNI
jgi:hypothetical protein